MCPTTIIQQKKRVLKISWISLLATGIGILGFGIIVTIYPQIAGPTEEDGLLRAIGVATTGMGIFGVMITLKAYRRKEKWAWFTLWYYPIFWTIHLVGGLPPGNDHIHQIVFIVISLLGLLLPIRQFFSRNMVAV
jgi:multisubunit Na+/H+ antiporter MnhF subunit